MYRFRYHFNRLRFVLGPLERVAQANVAMILAQALIIRLSLEIREPAGESPDVLVLLGFLGVCVVAGAIAVVLHRAIRNVPRRGIRIALALGSIALQAAAFQILISIAS